MAYKEWNDAILNNLFNTTDEEVFLFITKEVLDKIGKQNGLGNHNDFLEIFDHLDTPAHRASWFLNKWALFVGGICPINRSILNSKSIITFATAFVHPSLQRSFPYGYMNILALCLYIINDSQEQTSSALGKTLKKGLREFGHSENTSYDDIKTLFAHLSKNEHKFHNICINGYPYVGLLRYQLILTPQQEKDIEEALFRREIHDGADIDYRNAVYAIFDLVDNGVKKLLGQSFTHATYRERISRIIRNFDFDEYNQRFIDPGRTRPELIGNFVHAIKFISEPKMCVFTTICSEGVNARTNDGKRRFLIVPNNAGHIRGCNPMPVNFDQVPSIWENTEYRDPRVNISTYSHESGVIFFSKVNDSLYMETLVLEPNHPTFVAVRNDRKAIESWKRFINEGNIQGVPCPIPNAEAKNLIGDDTLLFQCSGFTGQFIKNFRRLGEATENKQVAISKQPELAGGLLYPGKKDVYFVNALPYIKIPYDYAIDEISFDLMVEEKEYEKDVDYRYEVKDDSLHFELIKTDLFSANGILRSLPIQISLNNTNNKYTFTIYASLCNEEFKKDMLYSLDRWGVLTTDEGETILTEGTPSGQFQQGIMPTNALLSLSPLDQKDLKPFALSHLLAVVFLTSNHKEMNARQLEDCIKFAGATDIETKSVIRSLIDLGFLQPSYGNGIIKYKALPPIFADAFAMADLNKGVKRRHHKILYGCFSRYFIDKLIEYCNNRGIDIYVRKNGGDTVIPPFPVIGEGFDPDDFQKETGCQIWRCDGDLGITILNACPTLDDFKSTLKKAAAANFDSQTIEDLNVPGLFSSIGPSYKRMKWYRHNGSDYYHSGVKDFGWIGLHALRQNESRRILVNGTSIILLGRIPLPYLLRRALCAMNIGECKHLKTFIAGDHPYVEGHNLFIDSYELNVYKQAEDTLKSIFGNDEKLYCGFSKKLYSLILYTNPEYFCNGSPRYCLEYNHSGCHIKAFWWTKDYRAEVYTKEEEGWLKVDMTSWGNGMEGIHKIFTDMIKNRNKTWINISHVTNKASQLCDISNYNKQEITILEI